MKKKVLPAIFAFILALSFTSCDSFFSSGWGNPRDYQAENINLTVHNLNNWFERAVGNPPLAKAVSDAVRIKLDSLPADHPDRAIFQRFGVRMAVSSSNMGVIILTNALDVLANLADFDDMSTEDMEDLLKEILGKIQDDFRNAGGLTAANNVTEIALEDLDLSGPIPSFPPDSFVHDATPSEIAQTILVLTLAIVEESNIEDITEWEGFDLHELGMGISLNEDGEVEVASDAPPKALVLAAYLNLILEDETNRFEDNFLTGALRDAFASRDR